MKVDLRRLAGKAIYEKVMASANDRLVFPSKIRDTTLKFHTPNKRSLWQAFGQEFIEPDLLDFIDEIPTGGVYFDIGASTGLFALYAAAKTIKTYAFEPEISNCYLLNSNFNLNYEILKDTLHVYNIAISNENNIQQLFMENFEPSSHQKLLSNVLPKQFKSSFHQNITCMTLDSFIASHGEIPTDIKIDVDGAEFLVLDGMKSTILNYRLNRIFIEVDPTRKTTVKIEKQLIGNGFKIIQKKQVQDYKNLENWVFSRGI